MRSDRLNARALPALRLAHALTGDPASAERVTAAAMARMPTRRHLDADELDRRLTALIVRSAGVPRPRAAAMLAFGLGWDPAGVAEACRCSLRAVRAAVRTALLTAPEQSGVAIDRVVAATAGIPPTPHVPGLLSWPARGALDQDRSVFDEAIRAWRRVAPSPAGSAYLLYAARVDDGTRLVVLQGYFEDTPAVAVVTDGHLARLVPLPTTGPSALAITYDAGAGVDVTRLLVAPGVSGVAVRSSLTVPQQRPAFVARRLTAGLSQSWATPDPTDPWPAVRITGRDGLATTGLINGRALLPVTVRPVLASPPARWARLPSRVPPSVLADDAVWFAQVCNSRRPELQAVWTGRVPGFTDPVRLERVRCGGFVRAVFLTGANGHAFTLRDEYDARPRLDVYAAVVNPPTGLGHTYVVVVGSRHVATIRVAGQRRHARVAVVRLEQSRDLRVFAADGTRIPVR